MPGMRWSPLLDEVMALNSVVWAGDNAAPANFPRYEKEIAGGITVCVVRGEAAAAASNVVTPLSRRLFAFEPLLVLLFFSRLLFVFLNLLLLLTPGSSLAELRLAIGAGDDDTSPVRPSRGELPRPGRL